MSLEARPLSVKVPRKLHAIMYEPSEFTPREALMVAEHRAAMCLLTNLQECVEDDTVS